MKTKTNIIAALFATLALPVQAADLKVGFVYVSPIGEADGLISMNWDGAP